MKVTIYPSVRLEGFSVGSIKAYSCPAGHIPGQITEDYEQVYLDLDAIEIDIELPDLDEALKGYREKTRQEQIAELEAKLKKMRAA